MLIFLLFPELLYHFFNLLRLALVREHRRIICLHQDGVAQANYSDWSPVLRSRVEDDIPRGIHVDKFTHCAVPFRVSFEVAGQRRPGTQIIPLEIPFRHHHVLRVFQ